MPVISLAIELAPPPAELPSLKGEYCFVSVPFPPPHPPAEEVESLLLLP